MAEVRGRKKILSINLSVFAPTDNINSPKSIKSPNKFEDPNGVVGLGIVAAMSNNQKCNKPPILTVSPRPTSTPIPILNNNFYNKIKKKPTIEEMEMCEEYTRVISHVGTNLVKKMEYYDDQFLGNGYHKTAIAAASAPLEAFRAADFLNICSLCHKHLEGLDIFIYRGEKAFCSSECRLKQISIDEHKEKCGSVAMKSPEFSAFPRSGTMQFSGGVAVA
ncbi:hypothetical protein AABB24_039913 [Solanum stoloniferum]|uniref:FLZ-type domain-containing protein n=1 Tax=Solanum stoloniferum TaxID=62892 RepID=A0ABD2QSQ3_9SOLN